MKNKRQIAEHIADRLFCVRERVGVIPSRIQFMVGSWADATEKCDGGMNKAAFRDWLFHELNSLPEHPEGE